MMDVCAVPGLRPHTVCLKSQEPSDIQAMKFALSRKLVRELNDTGLLPKRDGAALFFC
jgi:hypothetical protein